MDIIRLRAILVDEQTYRYQIINQIEGRQRGIPEVDLVQGYDGNFYAAGHAPEQPAPTQEEQEAARRLAYTQEVDTLTCHIERLRDEPESEENKAKIAALIVERSAKVAEIKAEYPYPETSA